MFNGNYYRKATVVYRNTRSTQNDRNVKQPDITRQRIQHQAPLFESENSLINDVKNVGVNSIKAINYADISAKTILDCKLTEMRIEAETWDTDDTVLFIPHFDHNSYTPLVTELNTYDIPSTICRVMDVAAYVFDFRYSKSCIFQHFDLAGQLVPVPPVVITHSMSTELLKLFGDCEVIETLHLMVTSIFRRMMTNHLSVYCEDHGIMASIVINMVCYSYDISGETDDKCVRCLSIRLLGLFAGSLPSKSLSMPPAFSVAINEYGLFDLSLTYTFEGGVINALDAFKLTDLVSVEDMMQSLVLYTFGNAQFDECERSDSHCIQSPLFSKFYFKSATRSVIGMMYVVAKQVSVEAKIVSLDYAHNNKTVKSGVHNYGRLAVQFPTRELRLVDQYIRSLRYLCVPMFAQTLFSYGITSFSFFTADLNGTKNQMESGRIQNALKLKAPGGELIKRVSYYTSMSVMPNAIIVWKSDTLLINYNPVRSENEVSYIEAKLSYAGKHDLLPEYVNTITGHILQAMLDHMKGVGLMVNPIPRTETESRVRFAAVNIKSNELKHLVKNFMGKAVRSGINGTEGYIPLAFRRTLIDRSPHFLMKFPEKVAVNLTFCNYLKNCQRTLDCVTPTEVVLLEKMRNEIYRRNTSRE